jgi:hypothetical protein
MSETCDVPSGGATDQEITEYNRCVAESLIENNPGIQPLIVSTDEFKISLDIEGTVHEQTRIIITDPSHILYQPLIFAPIIAQANINVYVVMNENETLIIVFNSNNYITVTQTESDPPLFNIEVVGTGSYSTPGLNSGTYTNVPIGTVRDDIFPRGTTVMLGSVFISTNGQFDPLSSNPNDDPAHGIMLAPGFTQDRTHTEFNNVRAQLRNAWNTRYKSQLKNANKKISIGGFRAVNNAGDLLGRKNYVCGGSNQISKSKPGYKGLMGSIMNQCDGTGVPAANCNPKYVYDSSDYIRYKKQRAHSRNYNDVPGGGTSTVSFVLGQRI